MTNEEAKMKTNLGFLHLEEEFVFDNTRYRAIRTDGKGNAICRNIENGKTEKICLDCEVEVKE